MGGLGNGLLGQSVGESWKGVTAFGCPFCVQVVVQGDPQSFMLRIFVSEYQIDGDRCSVTALLKFVINRSSENAIVLKLPKCCTVEAFEFAANVIFVVVECVQCPSLVTLSLPGDALDSKHTNLELIGKWKHLELCPKANFHGREAYSIVKLVLNIKYLILKGAKSIFKEYSRAAILFKCVRFFLRIAVRLYYFNIPQRTRSLNSQRMELALAVTASSSGVRHREETQPAWPPSSRLATA
ncbi:unnamed protein product [Prunus armeniaca]